jgi:hypothetical protein
MKSSPLGSVFLLVVLGASGLARAEGEALKNQVFFRGGYAGGPDRSGEVFVDTAGANGLNDDSGGLGLSAGLDIALKPELLVPNLTLVGEVFVEHAHFTDKEVMVATSALLGNPQMDTVQVTSLNVTIAPKLRYDGLGIVRPWVVPVGLAFLVNGPPSNSTNYLNSGLHFGGGLEVLALPFLSIGADFRYTYSFDEADTEASYYSAGGYAGINF